MRSGLIFSWLAHLILLQKIRNLSLYWPLLLNVHFSRDLNIICMNTYSFFVFFQFLEAEGRQEQGLLFPGEISVHLHFTLVAFSLKTHFTQLVRKGEPGDDFFLRVTRASCSFIHHFWGASGPCRYTRKIWDSGIRLMERK